MKLTKLTSSLLVSGIALSLGGATLASVHNVSAATVISQSEFEKVASFTKQDLEKATGINLTSSTLNQFYDSLKQSTTWERLDFNKVDAQNIASRVSMSTNQALGILREISSNTRIQFKVVLINQPNYSGVNIGTIGEPVIPDKPDNNEENNVDPETPIDSKLSSQVKEIEIELEYKKIGDIEIDYEVKSDGRIKAEVENEQTYSKVKDSAAIAVVENVFEGLDAKNMSREAIRNHVMNKLNVSETGLKKFDFKVKYQDQSKIDFKLKY